ANWHALSKEQGQEILEQNKKKERVPSLEAYAVDSSVEVKELVLGKVVGQDSLTRFDRPKHKRSTDRTKDRKSSHQNSTQSLNQNSRRKGPSNKKPSKNA